MSTQAAFASRTGAKVRQAGADRGSIAPLFSALVGEMFGDLKLGCYVANLIEGDLIRSGWPAGTIYGSELELCDRFNVGRTIVREAVRVLEIRGSARMRRGPNGGLQILRPGQEKMAEVVALYLPLIGVLSTHIEEARSFLERVRIRIKGLTRHGGRLSADELGSIEAVALPFFKVLLDVAIRLSDAMRSSADSSHHSRFHQSRAGQIAWRLISECHPQTWRQGTRLGTTFDLCERYSSDRSVLRQAARILESQGLATTICGRGHGLVTQAPSLASMCRPISCYFSAEGLSPRAALALFHCLSEEATVMVAERATPADVSQVELALDALEAACPTDVGEAIFHVEARQYAVIGNPLVELFLLGTKGFASWNLATDPRTSQLQHAVYLTETRKVAIAIASRNRNAAADAQATKNRRLAEMMLLN